MLATAYSGALLTVVGLVSVGPAQSGLPAFLRELLLLAFAPLPFLLAASLALRARAALIALALPLAMLASLIGQQFLPKVSAGAGDARVRVLTFNTGGARGLGQPAPIVGAVRSADPDVACLVEARRDSMSVVGPALSSTYPHLADGSSVSVLSRHPLLGARRVLTHSGAHDGLLVDLELDGRLVAFACVHLRRIDEYPGLGRGPLPLLRAAGGFRTAERDDAAADLAVLMRDLSGPRLVAGDFNMTRWSRSYELLTADLRDSFLEAGWGFGHTYPAASPRDGSPISVPLLRIDYIFHSADLIAVDTWVGPHGGSDHLPLTADLIMR